jgi:subtilase family serine protease
VNYPASSWWVTGVGGTNIVLDALNRIASQVVWDDGADQPGSAGGGGSSDLFRRPNYQKGTVKADSRSVPDVSLLADIVPGYAIFCSAPGDCINMSNVNPWQAVGGTSAATPLLAGGLVLVDQELRMHHRQSLGLANPLLYKAGRSSATARVFYDVTAIGNDVGPDIGGNGKPLGCCTAHSGYDQASGWGSLDVGGFAGLALSAQPKIVNVGVSLPRQSPVRAHELRAIVSCSGPCLMAAYTEVTIGRSTPFEIDSRLFRLRATGRRTIPLRFSSRQLGRLRSALAGRVRIRATIHGVLFDPAVYGVLPDPGSAIRAQTAGKRLTIAG